MLLCEILERWNDESRMPPAFDRSADRPTNRTQTVSPFLTKVSAAIICYSSLLLWLVPAIYGWKFIPEALLRLISFAH